jgi:hypothetical protein
MAGDIAHLGLTTELSGGGAVRIRSGTEALSRHPLQRVVSRVFHFRQIKIIPVTTNSTIKMAPVNAKASLESANVNECA